MHGLRRTIGIGGHSVLYIRGINLLFHLKQLHYARRESESTDQPGPGAGRSLLQGDAAALQRTERRRGGRLGTQAGGPPVQGHHHLTAHGQQAGLLRPAEQLGRGRLHQGVPLAGECPAVPFSEGRGGQGQRGGAVAAAAGRQPEGPRGIEGIERPPRYLIPARTGQVRHAGPAPAGAEGDGRRRYAEGAGGDEVGTTHNGAPQHQSEGRRLVRSRRVCPATLPRPEWRRAGRARKCPGSSGV